MQSITFTCEIITPMFLNGADGSTPELRAPSIKGALRFWWRAMNGHLSIKDLKKQENQLFGGTDNGGSRSELMIRVADAPIKSRQEMMVPHSRFRGMPQEAFYKGQTFKVILSFLDDEKANFFCNLFLMTTLLGGIGRRVRRGMGCWKVIKIDDAIYKMPQTLQEIFGLLNAVTPYYVLSNNKIFNNYGGRMEYYPWIKEIQMGINEKNNLLYISQKTHDFKEKNPHDYEPSMGHANRGRFASPIYVSTIDVEGKLMPIITSLNTIPDRAVHNINPILQRDFKNSILF